MFERILVCGSRSWDDYNRIYRVLEKLRGDDPSSITIIHGCASGADRLADNAARNLGFSVYRYPADWEKYGKRAGVIRNREMIDSNPDLVIAFYDGQSNGTAHTIQLAKEFGIPLRVILPEGYFSNGS